MSDHSLGTAADLLQDGQMKRFDLDGQPIVVARVKGEYFALGASCSHYGGPLDEGVLKDHSVMCPWHHACFDVRSGMRLEPPALNDVHHYAVRIENEQVVVVLPNTNEVEPGGKHDPADDHTFVIVGGGAAGAAAAEELRRLGFGGHIVILSDQPPIDRPNLSKDYLAGNAQPEWIPLREPAWYADRGIELKLNVHVAGIDSKMHTIKLAHGDVLHYDKLLLATGSAPNRLTVPGSDLGGIHTLRTLADANGLIQAASSGGQVVIVGASFIGLEAAASLAGGRKLKVTIAAIEDAPLDRVFGAEIGRMVQHEHEANGVQFRLKTGVKQFVGKNGHVTGVELTGGETLQADWVLLGVGVHPATEFLTDSGLKVSERDHALLVDSHLRTSDPDIFAAGDIARFPSDSAPGGTVRIEHWRVAEQHGLIAARGMLSQADDTARHVPFFWSNQWGLILDYVGHAERWSEIIYRGSVEQKNFLAFYVQDDRLLAAAGCGHDRDLDALEIILRDSLSLSVEQMRDAAFDLVALAQGRRDTLQNSA